jgi:hypothetical protein
LPNHSRGWSDFLARLKYIVVDEVHAYRARSLARLERLPASAARLRDARLASQFVCCSATVGNPGEHVAALFHRPFTVIDKDGSPPTARPVPDQSAARGERGFGPFPQGNGVGGGSGDSRGHGGGRADDLLLPRAAAGRAAVANSHGRPSRVRRRSSPTARPIAAERRQLEKDLFEAASQRSSRPTLWNWASTSAISTSASCRGIRGRWQLLAAGRRVGRKGNRALILFVVRTRPWISIW